MSKTSKSDIIYNAACPVCDAGIQAFRTKDVSVAYTDITANPDILTTHGLSAEDVQYRIHAVDADGTLVRGIDAVAIVLAQKPGWRFIAHFIGWPGIRQIGWLAYEIAAFALFRWNKWRGNF